jgi:hypothetical protein
LRWYTTCTITEADRGRVIEWTNDSVGLAIARWRYEFKPNGSGTTVIESTEDRRGMPMKRASQVVMGIADRDKHNAAGMEQTLQRLKAAAETR